MIVIKNVWGMKCAVFSYLRVPVLTENVSETENYLCISRIFFRNPIMQILHQNALEASISWNLSQIVLGLNHACLSNLTPRTVQIEGSPEFIL